jgi:hypothetical protein
LAKVLCVPRLCVPRLCVPRRVSSRRYRHPARRHGQDGRVTLRLQPHRAVTSVARYLVYLRRNLRPVANVHTNGGDQQTLKLALVSSPKPAQRASSCGPRRKKVWNNQNGSRQDARAQRTANEGSSAFFANFAYFAALRETGLLVHGRIFWNF